MAHCTPVAQRGARSRLPGARLPDSHHSIPAGGAQKLAIGTEDHRPEHAAVLGGWMEHLADLPLPHASAAVHPTSGKKPTIGAEGDLRHPLLVVERRRLRPAG